MPCSNQNLKLQQQNKKPAQVECDHVTDRDGLKQLDDVGMGPSQHKVVLDFDNDVALTKLCGENSVLLEVRK